MCNMFHAMCVCVCVVCLQEKEKVKSKKEREREEYVENLHFRKNAETVAEMFLRNSAASPKYDNVRNTKLKV